MCGKLLLPHLDFREFLMYQALKAAEAASAIFTSVLSVNLLKCGAIIDTTKFRTLKRGNNITNTCITTIKDKLRLPNYTFSNKPRQRMTKKFYEILCE